MPKEISDIKQFLQISRRKDATSARVKRSKKTGVTKFKVRCKKNLCTLVVKDADKADKLKQSFLPNLTVTEVPVKDKKSKRT